MKIIFTSGACGLGYAYMAGQSLDCTDAEGKEFIELGVAKLADVTPEPDSDLPADFPARDKIIAAGILKIADVPNDAEKLVEINGIGKATAKQIVDFLSK